MKYTGPKVRVSRALGVPLTPKAARIMGRANKPKNYPPGQHGPAAAFRRQRKSPYKEQLVEKQKLRAQYNIHEKQLRNYYKRAVNREGNTADNLMGLLESRLDSLVLRAGLAITIYQARQIVNHGHLLVNGKRVNIPSYSCRPGDEVSVRQKSQRMEMFQTALASGANSPEYVNVNPNNLTFTFDNTPTYEQTQVFADVPKVIEFYSR